MCIYSAPESLLYVYLPVCLCASVCQWLCISLALSLSLSPAKWRLPNYRVGTLPSRLTTCHFLPLKNCNRIAEILLNRALRGKDQRWCSNLKCTNAPPVHQTLHYNHQTWSPVETLGPKIGAGKVLWDSNNCTSRYSNCSYNQTPKPKLHSESID